MHSKSRVSISFAFTIHNMCAQKLYIFFYIGTFPREQFQTVTARIYFDDNLRM